MADVTYWFAKGGPLMYAVLAGAVLTLGSNVVLAAVLAFRKRIPGVLFLAMPFATVTFGLLGWTMGLMQIQDAVPHASLEVRDAMTFSGLSIAPLPQLLALVSCAVGLAWTAAILGLTVIIGAGKGAKWCIGGPVATFLLGLLGVVGTAGWALFEGHGSALLFLPAAVLLVAGSGVGLVGLRMGREDKDAQRCAAGRAFVGACAVMAVGCALVAVRMSGMMLAQEAVATASAEVMQTMMASGVFMARSGTSIGLAALAVAFVAHLIPVFGARKHLFKTFTLVSGSLCGVAVLTAAAGQLGVDWWNGTVEGQTMMFRSVEVADRVPGLPAPADTYSETRVSGFEAVITYSGGRWTREDPPLDQMDSWDPEFVALIATPATTPAQSLLKPQDLTAGGPPLDPQIQILVERMPTVDLHDNPYFEWGHLGVVRFAHLPLSRQPAATESILGVSAREKTEPRKTSKGSTVPSDVLTGQLVESAGILAALSGLDAEGDLFGTATDAWPPPEETLVVLDGSAALGGQAWGVTDRSRDTWIVVRGEPARSIGQGDSAAKMLRSIADETRPAHILFVPGEQWTVQDLVTLWMYATDPVGYGWDEWVLECHLDDHAPPPR